MEITVTIRKVNKKIWLAFRGLCLKQEKTVGIKLTDVMAETIRKEGEK